MTVTVAPPPAGYEQVGWIDVHGNLWSLLLRNGAVPTDRPVFAPKVDA